MTVQSRSLLCKVDYDLAIVCRTPKVTILFFQDFYVSSSMSQNYHHVLTGCICSRKVVKLFVRCLFRWLPRLPSFLPILFCFSSRLTFLFVLIFFAFHAFYLRQYFCLMMCFAHCNVNVHRILVRALWNI